MANIYDNTLSSELVAFDAGVRNHDQQTETPPLDQPARDEMRRLGLMPDGLVIRAAAHSEMVRLGPVMGGYSLGRCNIEGHASWRLLPSFQERWCQSPKQLSLHPVDPNHHRYIVNGDTLSDKLVKTNTIGTPQRAEVAKA